MRSPLSILLATLLLLQVGTDAVMIQWQQHARESFAELFCTNRAFEAVPMCYGSCQMPELFADLTDDAGGDELGTASVPTVVAPCLPVAASRLPVRPAVPTVVRRQLLATVPAELAGDFRPALLHPPLG